MSKKLKVAASLSLIAACLGLFQLIKPQGKPTVTAQTNEIKELPKGSDQKDPIFLCLPPMAEPRGDMQKLGPYTFVPFKIDFSEDMPHSRKHGLPDGVSTSLKRKKSHPAREGFHDPNFGAALMTLDPLSGCETVIRDLLHEPFPPDFPEEQKLPAKKMFWVLFGKELDSAHNISLQEWVLDRTGDIGPNVLTLSDSDIKALSSLRVKLQPWHDPKKTPEQRQKIFFDHLKKLNKNQPSAYSPP